MTNQEIFECFKGMCLRYAEACATATKDTDEIKKVREGLSQESIDEVCVMVDEWCESDEGIAANKKIEELEWM